MILGFVFHTLFSCSVSAPPLWSGLNTLFIPVFLLPLFLLFLGYNNHPPFICFQCDYLETIYIFLSLWNLWTPFFPCLLCPEHSFGLFDLSAYIAPCSYPLARHSFLVDIDIFSCFSRLEFLEGKNHMDFVGSAFNEIPFLRLGSNIFWVEWINLL